MRQLGVIRDKQAFSAADVAWEEYFFCGPSPEMCLFIPNDLWNIPWFIAHCEIPNSLIRKKMMGSKNICKTKVMQMKRLSAG